MRHLITTSIVACAVLVAFTGCEERQNMRVTPNRDDHAYVPPDHRSNIGTKVMAIEGEEIYYNWKAGDTLTNVAKSYNMTVEELIRRNKLKNGETPKAGDQIIVKKK